MNKSLNGILEDSRDNKPEADTLGEGHHRGKAGKGK